MNFLLSKDQSLCSCPSQNTLLEVRWKQISDSLGSPQRSGVSVLWPWSNPGHFVSLLDPGDIVEMGHLMGSWDRTNKDRCGKQLGDPTEPVIALHKGLQSNTNFCLKHQDLKCYYWVGQISVTCIPHFPKLSYYSLPMPIQIPMKYVENRPVTTSKLAHQGQSAVPEQSFPLRSVLLRHSHRPSY